MTNNPFRSEEIILQGNFVLVTEDNEFRMSHWVKGFGILDAKTNKWLIELNTSFDLAECIEKENTLHIRFRVYPNGHKVFEAILTPSDEKFFHGDKTMPLSSFKTYFNQLIEHNQ